MNEMKNNASFFRNCECEYFPCHKVENSGNFNCLFCYCPLYPYKECGGNYKITDTGIKDCSECILPHKAENYQYIINRLGSIEDYKQEVKEKWGKTDAFKEHKEKTKNYSKQKWSDLAEEMNQIMAEFAVCMKNGYAPESVEAQKLVSMLKNHITDNYYLCTNEILAGLGQMYVADERFKNNIDKHGDGTAQFICDAIGKI